MSRRPRPIDPCDLPGESLFEKHYSAALTGDGTVLPIEERLGRRLLRTIDAGSSEGRDLLNAGRVVLRDESEVRQRTISDALDRLEEQARERLQADDPDARRQLATTLSQLERHRLSYRN